MINDELITKYKFIKIINHKFNRMIKYSHVFSVIYILIDEIMKELKEGKTVRIVNFGKLRIKKTKPRRLFNVATREFRVSSGAKKYHFNLTRNFKAKFNSFIDEQKTFIECGEKSGVTVRQLLAKKPKKNNYFKKINKKENSEESSKND